MDFKDSHGNLIKGEDSIFPILTKNRNGLFEFLATGFFVGFSGEFVTAKHVVLNDKNKNQPYNPLYIVQSIKGKHFLRFVECIFPHPTSDIVFGKLHNIIQVNGKNLPFTNTEIPFQLSFQELKMSEQIKTFSFPNSKIEIDNNSEIGEFLGEWFNGEVKEYFPSGRDKVFYPDACYQTSINILGGASGGPVINSQTKVVGVNCSGYENLLDEQENISFITPIEKLLEIKVFINNINDTIENHRKKRRLNLLF